MIISAQILRSDMTSAARNLQAEFIVEERIHADIAELKADYRLICNKLDATRDDISHLRESVSAGRESVTTLRAEMKEGFANVQLRMAEEFATKADLAAKADEIHKRIAETNKKIDETRMSLIEHTEIVFDRKFFRATGIIVSAIATMLAAASFLQEIALSGSQIALVTVGFAAVVWGVSLFLTRRQRRA